MTTWYVSNDGSDSNSGNAPDQPFATIAGGLDLSGVGNGDTVYFANTSTFTDPLTSVEGVIYDGESWDGTSIVPTYIAVSETAASGNRATINSGDIGVGEFSVRINAADVTVKGFILTGAYYGLVRRTGCEGAVVCRVLAESNTNSGFGSTDATSAGDTFYACDSSENGAAGYDDASSVVSAYNGCTATLNATAGVLIAGTSAATLTRCTATNNANGLDSTSTGALTLVDSTFSSNTIHGVFLESTSGTTTFTITNCVMSSNTTEGVHIEQATKNGTISRCTADSNGGNGIRVYAAGTVTINRCKLRNNVGSGIQVSDAVLSASTTVNVWNSLIVSVAGNAPAQGGCIHGVHSTSPLGTGVVINVYNCATNNRNTSGTIRWSGIWLQNSTLCDANIQSWVSFVHTSTAFALHIWANNAVAQQLPSCNYNIYGTVSSNTSRWREGTTDYDFAGWKALTGTPDANSLNAAPGVSASGGDVTAPAYYRPTGTASNLLTVGGTNLFASPGITTDYDGRARKASGAWIAGLLLPRGGGGYGVYFWWTEDD